MKKTKITLTFAAVVATGCTAAFATLKLAGVLPWSWWMVTMPLWGSFLIFVFLVRLLTLLTAALFTMPSNHTLK